MTPNRTPKTPANRIRKDLLKHQEDNGKPHENDKLTTAKFCTKL